jgi:hypothetical protein
MNGDEPVRFCKRSVIRAEINSDASEEIKNESNKGLVTIWFTRSKVFGRNAPSCPWRGRSLA